MRRILFVLVVCCLAFCGLQKAEGDGWLHSYLFGSRPNDIQETNKTREKIGLRPINTNWFFGGVKSDWEIWLQSPTGPEAKRVQRNTNNEVISEDDIYYSGMTFTNQFGNGWECLFVLYSYTNNCLNLDYMGTNSSIKTMTEPFLYQNTNFNAAVDAANKILKEWKTSRL
jgi:hypothetical protein